MQRRWWGLQQEVGYILDNLSNKLNMKINILNTEIKFIIFGEQIHKFGKQKKVKPVQMREILMNFLYLQKSRYRVICFSIIIYTYSCLPSSSQLEDLGSQTTITIKKSTYHFMFQELIFVTIFWKTVIMLLIDSFKPGFPSRVHSSQ